MGWATLGDRKRRAAVALAAAVERLAIELQSFAAGGGRFILFGSAARGELRFDSDVDILVDFPPEQETAAWRFAEDACRRHGLKPDIRPLRFCDADFVSHVLGHARILCDDGRAMDRDRG